MTEQDLRDAIEDVRRGKLSRRAFTLRMIGLGLTAPLAAQMLVSSGLAEAAEQPIYRPTKRGGGGPLKVLWWQGPTLLNPHFAVGTKDQDGSRVFYEPLAGWDPDGNLAPVLAAEIPTIENGGLAKDGLSVTWKLKQGVRWHDGQPFTADDCVFTWRYAADPATAATTIGSYQDVNVARLNDHTVRVEFEKPTPFWADAFVGVFGMLLPKHIFEPYTGSKSPEAPANLAPVGTGPYTFVGFNPGDLVQGKLNPNYHQENRPYFDTFEMKGGGDAVSAARAVLQTGEYDFAWNMQVEPDTARLLKRPRDDADGPYVFRSERGGPMSVDAVQVIVARAGREAGLRFKVHPHMLRHACGFFLAEQGTDTRLIQDYLGHKDIKNTVIYTETSQRRLSAVRVR